MAPHPRYRPRHRTNVSLESGSAVTERQANLNLVRRSLDDVYTGGNLDAADEVFATDFVAYDPTFPNGVLRGPEGIKANVRRGHESFDNWRFDIEDLLCDGDKVVARVVMRGRSRTDFLGMPAADKEITVSGITINRIANGRIIERWGNWDTVGMLRQFGVINAPEQIG
jgi:steroid delta-isomerase-like uncharacterized protein